MMTRWALAFAALLQSAPAIAADFSFTVHDVSLGAPLPAGYCLPANRDKLVADTLASGDADNVTHAMLIRCDEVGTANGPGNDYILIKTPKASLPAVVSRSELIR